MVNILIFRTDRIGDLILTIPTILTIKTARTVPISTLAQFYLKCKDAYFYTDSPLVDDDTFDAIEVIFRERSPNHKVLRVTGAVTTAQSTGSGKQTLPYWMGSQDKVYGGSVRQDCTD